MARNKIFIAVDKKFFDTIFEKDRQRIQKKIGGVNLSQANFTKMIKGFKIQEPKIDLSKSKRGKKRNDFALF